MKNILQITNPGLLFTGNKDTLDSEYKELIKQYHPDVNKSKDANNIFIKIKELYQEALSLINIGKWDTGKVIILQDQDKDTYYKITYYKKHDFELGDMYIGDKVILYLVNNKYDKFIKNALKQIKNIKYIDNTIKSEFELSMPKIIKVFKTKFNYTCIVINKDFNMLCLHDINQVLISEKRSLDPRHVAWILNRLLNFICFLRTSFLTHNDISLKTIFISPDSHSAFIYGGWWYSCVNKDKLIGLPKRTLNLIDLETKTTKQAKFKTDIECIKELGRTLLGDPTGVKLNKINKNIDKFIMWLRSPAQESAINEYVLFENVLLDTFGAKKFINLDISKDHIYK